MEMADRGNPVWPIAMDHDVEVTKRRVLPKADTRMMPTGYRHPINLCGNCDAGLSRKGAQ